MSYNPFTVLPENVCEENSMPALDECQDGTSYPQRLSQVCALILLPVGAEKPSDWTTIEGWEGIIDNSDTTGTKGRYLVGIGSFLPESQVVVNLAESRKTEVRDRGYRARHRVLNMSAAHRSLGRKIELGYKDFDVWLETVGGRVIGGAEGMRPVFVDANFPFDGGNGSREVLELAFDFFFLQFPDVTDLSFTFDSDGNFWGDPEVPEIWGDPGGGTGWGWQ